VETATFESEFLAARICVEHVINGHNTSQFLGVLIREQSYMFRDNKSVIDSFIQLRHYVIVSSCKGSYSSWNTWLLSGYVNQ
jgi:hypothetical protein